MSQIFVYLMKNIIKLDTKMIKCIIVNNINYKKIDINLDTIPRIGETININDTLLTGKVIKVIHDINTNMDKNDIRNHIITIYIE